MKKLFISQPMRGYTDEEILKVRDQLKRIAEAAMDEELEVLPSFLELGDPGVKNPAVFYLGRSIQILADADVMITMGDTTYGEQPGCDSEYDIAKRYGIYTIVYDGDNIPIIREHRKCEADKNMNVVPMCKG